MSFSFNAIYNNYSEFRENSLHGLQVKAEEIRPLLEKAKNVNGIEVSEIGKSFLGESIHKIVIGSGSKKILAWSQMHGNEATATKVVFDLVNLISKRPELTGLIFSKLQLTVIPMLNPDGAKSFTRINAQGIDINRDAYASLTPESKILHKIFAELKPEFCLNLHDQRPIYNVGESATPATLSFLAPPYNKEVEVNEERLIAIKMVVALEKLLTQELKIGISRYSDTYERRAFGDTFQSKNVPTVLFEAGGYRGDHDRELVRSFYFMALLSSLHFLAEDSFLHEDPDDYFKIPVNEELLFDWIIRRVKITDSGKEWIADVGGQREYSGSKYGKGIIEEIGDLSQYYGYTEIDGSGCILEKGKVLVSSDENNKDTQELVANGYTTIQSENFSADHSLAINIQRSAREFLITPGHPANLVVFRNKKIVKVILNGFILDPSRRPFENYYGISLE